MPTRLLAKVHRTLTDFLRVGRRLDDVAISQGRILTELLRDRRGASLSDYEFKVFSQWGEDGIIQFLTHNLAISEKTFIEFGVEDFFESNCRFLLQKDHWRGFVIDGSQENIQRLRGAYFYWQSQLQAITSFITRENVAELLHRSGFARDLGILSIDIDGVDYHVLESLGDWRAAIIIVEYNDAYGWQRPISVPYDPSFVRARKHASNLYWGANLPAFVHLLGPRGYALVGTNSVGSNAFFVRRDLLNERVIETSLAACAREAVFRDSRDARGELTFLSGRERVRAMANMPVVDVSTGITLHVGELLG
jgi:hypothetical protein